jgi:hypothetical protein
MKKTIIASILSFGAVALGAGCDWFDLGPKYADSEYAEALPQQDDLKIKMGQYDTEDGTSRQAELDPFATCPDCCIEEVDGEQYYVSGDIYELTREAMWHVNGGLAVTMGWIEAIIAYPATEETDTGYIWGPWSDDLSRIEFRFVMDKDSGDLFTFRLEGKNINDTSDNWQTVVDGEVTPGDEPHKGVGWVRLDFDTVHDIDSSHPSSDSGVVTYDFDVREYPYTVDVKFENFSDEQESDAAFTATYNYEKREGMAGVFHFTAQMDVTGPDDTLDGVLEKFDVGSEWTETGEGRGEANVSGGSLEGTSTATYALTECWADSEGLFYQTYAHEEVTFDDESTPVDNVVCGEESHCPAL